MTDVYLYEGAVGFAVELTIPPTHPAFPTALRENVLAQMDAFFDERIEELECTAVTLDDIDLDPSDLPAIPSDLVTLGDGRTMTVKMPRGFWDELAAILQRRQQTLRAGAPRLSDLPDEIQQELSTIALTLHTLEPHLARPIPTIITQEAP